MISFELSQVVERPIDHVFYFLRDFSNMPLWNYYVKEVTQLTPGEIVVGTVFRQRRKHDMQVYKIAVLEPPSQVVIELQPPGPPHRIGFELKRINNYTQLHYRWQVELDNYKMLRLVPKSIFKRWLLSFAQKHILTSTMPAVEQNFLKLKLLLEKGEAILQDGRKVQLNFES